MKKTLKNLRASSSLFCTVQCFVSVSWVQSTHTVSWNLESNHTQITLDNHCTRTAQSSRGGCSRRVHKIDHLSVKKGNNLVNVLLLQIFIANYYHL